MARKDNLSKAIFSFAAGVVFAGGIVWHAPAFVEAGGQAAPAGNKSYCVPPPAKPFDLSPFDSRSVAEFYQSVSADRQFMLYGDNDHSDHRIYDYFYTKEHIDYLSLMGVEAIFIERALDTQKGIDDLIAGSLTPEEFATQYDGGKLWDREGAEEARMRVAEGILYAASRGIKLLSANIFTKGIASPEERAEIYGFFGGMSAAFEKECPGAQFMTQEFNEKYWVENISRLKITPERFEEIMGERSNDSGRVAFIKEAAGGKRSVILFGNGHFTGAPKSIKTLLGTENVVHISMFPETAKLTHYNSGNNKADFLFLTGEQRIYKVGDIPFSGSGAAKKPGAPAP